MEKKHGNPIAFLKWVADFVDENGNYIELTGDRWHFSDKDDTDAVTEDQLWELYKMHHPEVDNEERPAERFDPELFKVFQDAEAGKEENLKALKERLIEIEAKAKMEQPGPRWVKASEPSIKAGEYVAKFKPVNKKRDAVGVAFVDDKYVRFLCPPYHDIIWCRGHEELKYLQVLDEGE